MTDLNVPYYNEVQREIKSINDSQATNLNKNDIAFIGVIAGLQILRQWLSRNKIINRQRLDDQEAARLTKHNTVVEKVTRNKNYGEWILGPTSYDAIVRVSDNIERTGVSGVNHRYKTLAHDSLIGLLVGPINLISESITYSSGEGLLPFQISKAIPIDPSNAATGYQIGHKITFTQTLGDTVAYIKDDKAILPAAIVKHLLHLASDMSTTQGLVIPGLTALPNVGDLKADGMNRWLLDNQFDAVWFANIGAQYGLAELINSISRVTYSFVSFYNKDISKEIIRRKTDKVIAIANSISTSTDIMRAFIRGSADPIAALRELDWGGLIATIKWIFSSEEFKEDVQNIDKIWNQISFGMTHSIAQLEDEFQKQLTVIDKKYVQILEDMKKEYAYYAKLQSDATNWNQESSSQVKSSIKFAEHNGVKNILRTKKDRDNFFNN